MNDPRDKGLPCGRLSSEDRNFTKQIKAVFEESFGNLQSVLYTKLFSLASF